MYTTLLDNLTPAGRNIWAAAAAAPALYTRSKAAHLDHLDLAGELSRMAAVAARHLSYAELEHDQGHLRRACEWLASAERHENAYHVLVGEATSRLVENGGDQQPGGELYRYLILHGALAHVVAPASA